MKTYDTASSATAAVTIIAALAGTSPGTGAPGAAVPMSSISATSVVFGNVVVNTPATQTLTLTSTVRCARNDQRSSAHGFGLHSIGSHFPDHIESRPDSDAQCAVRSGCRGVGYRSTDHHQQLFDKQHGRDRRAGTGTAPAGATTYYVDNCVTVGNDTNNGTSTSTPWLTIAHVNAHGYNPGDSILFQSTCTWREELIPPNSGSSGNPITFGAYGTRTAPIISGGDLITGFTVNVSNPNIWNATVTTQPNIAIINGSVGTLKASAAAIAAPGDWYWTANTLSVYGTSDPSGTVVAGARNAGYHIGSNSYVTVTGLTVTASNVTYDGAVRGSNSDNVVILKVIRSRKQQAMQSPSSI